MFHLKYRPQTFDTFFGNDSVVSSLQDKLAKQELSTAYLFVGQSGTGKTSLAYIFAHELGADSRSIVEVNAGAEGKVDVMRSILDSVQYLSVTGSNVKVYIIDECHKLTQASQAALLKILEEGCPDHVFFIFCTDQPGKLSKPLKRRCMYYELHPLRPNESQTLFEYICEQEKLQFSSAVSNAILKASNGVPSDIAMSVFMCKDLPDKDAISLLEHGITSSAEVIDICKMLVQGKTLKWSDLMGKVDKLVKEDNPESVRRLMFNWFAACLKNSKTMKDVGQYTAILEVLDFRLEDGTQGHNMLVYLLGRIVVGLSTI